MNKIIIIDQNKNKMKELKTYKKWTCKQQIENYSMKHVLWAGRGVIEVWKGLFLYWYRYLYDMVFVELCIDHQSVCRPVMAGVETYVCGENWQFFRFLNASAVNILRNKGRHFFVFDGGGCKPLNF